MKLIDSLLTLGKVALKSRRPSPGCAPSTKEGKTLVVMGNGPSLRGVLSGDRRELQGKELMAVNFAANAPEFVGLKPRYYILADPHFFRLPSKDPNVTRLWENLGNVDWAMTLFVPVTACRDASRILSGADCGGADRAVSCGNGKNQGSAVSCGNGKNRDSAVSRGNGKITLKRFNMTPAEGSRRLLRHLFDLGLAMPRPRNVMIPAIMCGLREGFRTLELVGADHTWTQSLWVDDKNRVVSVQPHFYEDNKKELDRVAKEYEGYHLHDILNSLTIAFRSYFTVRAYADSIGASIINRTPGSFIDAFERG